MAPCHLLCREKSETKRVWAHFTSCHGRVPKARTYGAGENVARQTSNSKHHILICKDVETVALASWSPYHNCIMFLVCLMIYMFQVQRYDLQTNPQIIINCIYFIPLKLITNSTLLSLCDDNDGKQTCCKYAGRPWRFSTQSHGQFQPTFKRALKVSFGREPHDGGNFCSYRK